MLTCCSALCLTVSTTFADRFQVAPAKWRAKSSRAESVVASIMTLRDVDWAIFLARSYLLAWYSS